MSRIILPSVLLAAAVMLFTLYTNTTYQETKILQAKVSEYDEALNKSQELKKVRDQLISRRNTFKSEDLQKLERILPDNVDNIRLIIDINSIAARHGLTLKNVVLGSISDSTASQNPSSVGSSGSPVGSISLEFTVSATYDSMLTFLEDIEHSLRIIDIEEISFQINESGSGADFTFAIRTYWLH